MKLLLLIALGTCLCVHSTEGQRGARRFSLASPGVQVQGGDEAAEEVPVEVVESAPKTRSRTPPLLRRGRPSLRVRNKASAQSSSIDVAEIEAVEKVKNTSPPRVSTGGRRRPLKLRRPIKPTSAPTTTTTIVPETELPVEASKIEVANDASKDDLIAIETQSATEEQGEKVVEEEIKPTTPVTQIPKKIRPIPIKIGRRGQGSVANTKSVVPDHQPKDVQQEKVTEPKHRFATRNRSPLRIRTRGRGPGTSAQIEETAKEAETEKEPTVVQPISRSRTRVPALRRPVATRGPGRTRIRASVADKTPETPKEVPLAVAAEEATQTDELSRVKVKKTKKNILKAPISEAVLQAKPKIKKPQADLIKQEHVTSKPRFSTPKPGGVDLGIRGGITHEVLVGTIEDTPYAEIETILSGFGSRRRGLSRPKQSSQVVKDLQVETTKVTNAEIEYLYDYLYEDLPQPAAA